jgi:transposase-like protein
VLEFAKTAKAKGQADASAATELGPNVHTLRYWRTVQSDSGQLVPVAIVAARAPAPELVLECGKLRVRGLDIESLAALLGRLA